MQGRFLSWQDDNILWFIIWRKERVSCAKKDKLSKSCSLLFFSCASYFKWLTYKCLPVYKVQMSFCAFPALLPFEQVVWPFLSISNQYLSNDGGIGQTRNANSRIMTDACIFLTLFQHFAFSFPFDFSCSNTSSVQIYGGSVTFLEREWSSANCHPLHDMTRKWTYGTKDQNTDVNGWVHEKK